ncbi:MAG: hypothetical protein QOG54_1796 [Actinomycetota bacterium]|jgi:hypothetical protein|nr:hypothetical protein [Actinomycetota bacterium]
MRKLVMLAVAALVMGLLAPAALAGGEVRRSGSCSASSNWKIKVKPDNGGTEVEFEVDQNRNGQDWHVILKRDGNRFFSGTKTTKAPSGSFEVRKMVNASGGTYTATAHNLEGSGEVCRGRASL